MNTSSPSSSPAKSLKRGSFLRHTTALFVVLAGAGAMVLFSVKYQVHDLETQQKRLVRELGDERRALHVLRAEWANLNDPARLKILAEQYLGMKAMLPNQVVTLSNIKNIAQRDPMTTGQGGHDEKP